MKRYGTFISASNEPRGLWFAIDGKFFRFMSKLADLMILNLLWILCSVPIITIGASTAALYKVTMEMAENRESYVVRTFIRTYLDNMKRATVGWMAFLTCQTVLAAAFVYGQYIQEGGREALVVGIMVCEILLMLVFLYIVPLMTRKGIETNVLRLAALLAVANLPWSAMLLAGEGVILLMAVRYPAFTIPVLLVVGVSGTAYMMSHIYLHVFEKAGLKTLLVSE